MTVPGWLRALETVLLRGDDREFLAGDLEEDYRAQLRAGHPHRARTRYVRALLLASSRNGPIMINQLGKDLRHAARALRRRPAFSIAAILTLGIGIGATTAIFSVADAVLLRPLSYPDPQRILFLSSGFPGAAAGGDQLSYLDLREIAARSRTLQGIGAYNTGRALQLQGSGAPERVRANLVAPSYLTTLGAAAARGRLFGPDDDRAPNAHPVVVLSHDFWRRRLAADPAAVGRTLILSDVVFTVVGVLDASFHDVSPEDGFGYESDVFIPEMMAPSFTNPTLLADRGARNFWAVARVAPGFTVAQAQAEVAAIGAQLQREMTANRGFTFWAERLDVYLAKDVRGPIVLLLIGSLFVLLIGATNVANLLLERVSSRSRELTIRRAIGAGRRHLVSLLFAESLALAAAGGAVGIAVAAIGAAAFQLLVPANLAARLASASLNSTVMIFAAVLTIGVALALGVVTALRLSHGAGAMPATGQRSTDRTAGRTRRALLVAEVAAAVMLVIAAGLMLDSLARLRRTDLGFHTERLVTLQMDLRSARYRENAAVAQFGRDLVRELGSVGGVESASIWGPARLGHSTWITFPGREDAQPSGDKLMTWRHTVSPGALPAVGIALRRGRDFTDHDNAASPPVVIVSETLAGTLWPGEDAIGKRLKWDVERPDSPLLQVIGIAADAMHRGRVNDLLYPARDVYLPHAQRAERMVVAVVRASHDPATIAEPLRQAIARLDPDLPLFGLTTMTEQLAVEEAETRFAAVLMGTYAAVALLLAAVGIYGVLSYHVTLRSREIAVRMALGAARRDVHRMIVVDGMRPALLGIALGLAGAAGLTRFLASLLFRIQPRDPLTFAIVALILGLVSVGATLLPARRATSVEPLEALRAE